MILLLASTASFLWQYILMLLFTIVIAILIIIINTLLWHNPYHHHYRHHPYHRLYHRHHDQPLLPTPCGNLLGLDNNMACNCWGPPLHRSRGRRNDFCMKGLIESYFFVASSTFIIWNINIDQVGSLLFYLLFGSCAFLLYLLIWYSIISISYPNKW